VIPRLPGRLAGFELAFRCDGGPQIGRDAANSVSKLAKCARTTLFRDVRAAAERDPELRGFRSP
jgi:hypothetical protein